MRIYVIIRPWLLNCPFTANSGKFYLEFRSDCATVGAGWSATWTCNTNPPACGAPDGLNETDLNAFGATLNWNPVAGATSYEVRTRNSLVTNWTFFHLRLQTTSLFTWSTLLISLI